MLAGPGSGKTSVLISHIQQLITNGHARPEEILVVTFTRAAAKEMRDRFLKNSGASSTRVTFGTLHGVFYAILRGTKKTLDKRLVAGEEKRRILYTLLDDLGQDRQQRKEQAELLEKEFSQVKKCGDLEHFEPESLDKEQFVQDFTAYNGMLVRENGMDFDDLAPAVHKLLTEDENVRKYWQSRFSFVLVDEFQDIDIEQYELLKLISAPQNNLFLVGDDDQSIYGFRGAAPEVMQRVPVDFPELSKVVLDVNYRCKSRIIDHAGSGQPFSSRAGNSTGNQRRGQEKRVGVSCRYDPGGYQIRPQGGTDRCAYKDPRRDAGNTADFVESRDML